VDAVIAQLVAAMSWCRWPSTSARPTYVRLMQSRDLGKAVESTSFWHSCKKNVQKLLTPQQIAMIMIQKRQQLELSAVGTVADTGLSSFRSESQSYSESNIAACRGHSPDHSLLGSLGPF
jgi:hypothetical protein